LLSSKTELKPKGAIVLKYSQLDGVDYEGGKSKSFVILVHELRHARDYANGTFLKDAKADPKNYMRKGEERAVNIENIIKVAFGDKNIRTTYDRFGRIVPPGTTWKGYDTKQNLKELKSVPPKKQP
jgi:N-acetylglucosamine kinase-like BadF-type ATPase